MHCAITQKLTAALQSDHYDEAGADEDGATPEQKREGGRKEEERRTGREEERRNSRKRDPNETEATNERAGNQNGADCKRQSVQGQDSAENMGESRGDERAIATRARAPSGTQGSGSKIQAIGR